ncbi:MAG: NADPH-dependent 7-cyano-7-deazaguanine reductase QueF [Thermoplasmata archaeon]|nr:MAG: NADPH-dependent 7-cyano-7-deazaguanine reductase QueF [Thermoplasmata archaeon]
MKYGEKAIKEAKLEVWENPSPDKNYLVEISFPEFTCLCPRSGYPDFAEIKIIYIPDKYIVELRSLKHYLNSYRDKYMTHEEATNRIYDDLKKLLNPRYLEVIGDFNIRGGIKTVVKVSSETEATETHK